MVQLPQENSIFTRTVRRAAGEDRLSHAVILTGRGDLTAAARFLAAAHVCEGTDRPCLRCRHCRKVLEGIHPDVIPVLDTEHKELTVEAVRALRKDVYIRPNEARRKVYVVSDCRQLNQRDQDVLLKVVEEGPPYAAFIFCADAPAALLETVRSRCALLKYDGEDAPLSDGTAELCPCVCLRASAAGDHGAALPRAVPEARDAAGPAGGAVARRGRSPAGAAGQGAAGPLLCGGSPSAGGQADGAAAAGTVRGQSALCRTM